MGRKRGLTRADVVAAAADIADESGIEDLNLAAVAVRLGVRPPSLYHHVDGLDGLRREIALRGAVRLRDALAGAASGLSGHAALIAVGRAYRRFARRHPGQLAAALPAPRRAQDPELYQALAAPVADIASILADLGITGDAAIHVIRALRAYLHGFIDLERRGGFGMPQRIEASFERGLALLVDGLARRR